MTCLHAPAFFSFLKLNFSPHRYVGHEREEVGRFGPLFGLHWNFWSFHANEKFVHARYSPIRALVRARARLATGFSCHDTAR